MGSSSSTEACQSNPNSLARCPCMAEANERVILTFYPMTLIVLLLKKGDGDRPRLFSMQLRPSCGKWVRERSIPNPICGVTGRLGLFNAACVGSCLAVTHGIGVRHTPAISDNRDGEKLNHERRDSNSKNRLHVRTKRAGLLYRDRHCR